MSYILDALKRADTERTRGAVPGLHARQLPSSGSAAPPLLQQRVWLLIVAAGVLGALAAGLWVWRTQPEAPGLPVPAPLVAAPVALPTPMVAPEPKPATPAPRPATPAPVAPTANAQPKAESKAALAPPRETSKAADAPAAATAKTSAPASAAQPQAVQASAPPAVTPVAPAATPLLSELSDTLRRQLPKLAITGTVYAEDPKQRLLLVNNQVLPQGSVVAPELTLEEIRPRSSVFNFRGTRFRVAH